MTSTALQIRAQSVWQKADKTHKRAILWTTLRASRSSFAYCIFPRLCLIGFRYAQPFLLSRTVNFANNTREPDSIGWGLTAAFGLVFTGLAIATGSYYHMVYRFVTSVRGILVSMIYTKTVDLSITALDESAAITLMATDTGMYYFGLLSAVSYSDVNSCHSETICLGFTNIHEIWAVPIELGIALWLLERQLGLAFLAPAAVAFIATAVVFWIAKYLGIAQKIWNEGIQTRVGVTAAMISSMKVLLLQIWTPISC